RRRRRAAGAAAGDRRGTARSRAPRRHQGPARTPRRTREGAARVPRHPRAPRLARGGLPAPPAPPGAAHVARHELARPALMNPSRGKRILIVDDVPDNLSVLFAFLTEQGFRVFAADSGEQALDELPSILPDLILLDVMMPGLDGFETCRRLK